MTNHANRKKKGGALIMRRNAGETKKNRDNTRATRYNKCTFAFSATTYASCDAAQKDTNAYRSIQSKGASIYREMKKKATKGEEKRPIFECLVTLAQ